MMRTIEEYFKMPYRMEIVPDTAEGGYAASFPELPGCITCGKTIEDAVTNAMDAKREWLEAAIENDVEIICPDSVD